MHVAGLVIDLVLVAYLGLLIARMVLSWVPLVSPGWRPRGAVLVAAEAVYSATDPPLKAIGRVIPPVRLGAVALDVGFMILWIGVLLLRQVNARVFGV